MKIIQKLEICTGIATPIAALILFYFGFFRYVLLDIHLKGEITSEMLIFGSVFFAIGLSSLMVAGGAYYEATKRSDIAFVALCSGSFFIIIILGTFGLALMWTGILYLSFVISPALLSAITVILASAQRTKESFIKR